MGQLRQVWSMPPALPLLLAAVLLQAGEAACNCTKAVVKPAASQELDLPPSISYPAMAVLLSLSALFSGLALGLMGLDLIGLQIVGKGDNPELARCAQRITPVRERGNELLCSLLLGNTAANSAISIVSAKLSNGLIGFLVSTVLILFVGDILPQAACSRYALQIGAFAVPLVKVVLLVFFIFSKPLSVLLDFFLGEEVGTIHSRTELMEMLKLQIEMGAVDEAEGAFAKQVAEGALNFRDKTAQEIMTPVNDAYMLSTETRLGYHTIREIFETGFSRVPVYGKDRHDYRGLLYTKDLMLADPEDEMKLGDFINVFQRKVETFFEDTKLVQVLNTFKRGGTHMGLVRSMNTEVDTSPYCQIVGVLTLEDVVEEILQDEIVDETDVYVDVDNRVPVEDGRERRRLNLGLFNPVWRTRGAMLSRDEVAAIVAHLERSAFGQGLGLELSPQAIEWLVRTSEVMSRARVTPLDVDEPQEADWIYKRDVESDRCTLVLQGRLGVRVGHDHFRSEAGAFSILGRAALREAPFIPDFSAHVGTLKGRYLSISKAGFQAAQALDKDPEALQRAINSLVKGQAASTGYGFTTSRRSPRGRPASRAVTLPPFADPKGKAQFPGMSVVL